MTNQCKSVEKVPDSVQVRKISMNRFGDFTVSSGSGKSGIN